MNIKNCVKGKYPFNIFDITIFHLFCKFSFFILLLFIYLLFISEIKSHSLYIHFEVFWYCHKINLDSRILMSNNNNKIQFIFCLLCAIFLIQIFSMFPNQNVKQNEFGKGVSLNNSGSNISPKAADSPISFINSFVNFTVQPKGYMLGTGSITYDNVSQNMDWLPYLMINTGNVSAFSSFTELQSFQNLTNISPNTNEIAEGIIQYPYANVNVTYIIELYPNSRFFVVVFYVNSPTLNNYLANLFLYNDSSI